MPLEPRRPWLEVCLCSDGDVVRRALPIVLKGSAVARSTAGASGTSSVLGGRRVSTKTAKCSCNYADMAIQYVRTVVELL